MGKRKIFNDPIYGIIDFPFEILYDLIDHPYFQRLRRISQTGLANYVYPGAMHTRFQHALGALHLMTRAVSSLQQKGIDITEAEAEAVQIAILLHDIGHGPYSHALERVIIDCSHEELSVAYIDALNEQLEGRLSLAKKIFLGQYHKPFLHELVSSQLDMDRMDYLSRDSYFTGVAEGVIGYDRLIKMLNVKDGHLVVEEKGIYSVEKFLLARRLMYWQVYLHKTAVGVEQMLLIVMKRIKYLLSQKIEVFLSPELSKLLIYKETVKDKDLITKELLNLFSQVEDIDILMVLKRNVSNPDYILSYMCRSLIKRQLFKVYLRSEEPPPAAIMKVKKYVREDLGIESQIVDELVVTGFEDNQLYSINNNEIRILQKTGDVVPFSHKSELRFDVRSDGKYFVCHPGKSLFIS